ncbi:carbonic anhydrase [Bifidobacterium sp. ESL0690]|uniref:carbonic anhydrase n=1 Tax=Bifidobacterium sp. ESL0690 TaxID=2983214 RepID=UPI0023FA4A68|nr:carbonic anhydrase [Bifidobacterium sp. ESL0690]WEV47813.1 carbonic anhydrase [Bifidobacterium sp. ESL0690]
MLQGNARFASGQAEHPWQDKETRESLIDGQQPDAAVLSCSDSRVPPEIIFDQGLGDMFTVRTAGQTLDDAVVASLEYAVTHLGISVLVVLGHEHCGAVASAVAELDAIASGAGIDLGAAFAAEVTDSEMIDPAADTNDGSDTDTGSGSSSANLDEPGLDDTALAARTGMDADDVFDKMEELVAASESVLVRSVGASVLAAQEAALSDTNDFERVHIARTIEALVDRSTIIQEALAAQRLSIVGARYQLTTGKVEVLSF